MRILGFQISFLLLVFNGVQLNQVCDTFLKVPDDSKRVYKYGDSVNFSCEVNSTSVSHNISTFYLLHSESQTKFPITKVSGNVGFANVKVVSRDSGGNYSCRYGNCTIDTLLSLSFVKVDKCSFPAQNITKAPTIDCKVNDLFNMTCSWTSLTDDGCTMWKAMYKSEEMDKYKCCSADGSGNCTSSYGSRRHCNIPDTDFNRFIPFNITLIEKSEQGTNEYNYTVVGSDKISSVDIYPGVTIQPGLDAHTLVVGFTLHHPPSSVGGMVCHVIYLSEWKLQNDLKITLDTNHFDLDVNISLHHLIPFTRYTVNISCKPVTSHYWSNQVTGLGRTRPAVPLHVPKIIGYSNILTKSSSTSNSKLFLYLEPLTKSLWYGMNASYLVIMADDETTYNQSIPAYTVTSELYQLIDKNQSSCMISVRTENEAGSSKRSDPVRIANLNEEDQPVLVVEKTRGNIQLLLYSKYDDNYEVSTYYYCQGTPNTYPPICKTNLEKTFEPRFQLPGNLTNYSSEWYFGMTSSEEDGRIIWSNCVLSSENAVSQKQDQLELSASALPSNESVARLHLLFDYCSLKKRPLLYEVAIREAKQNQTDICSINNISAFQNFSATPFVRDLYVFVGSMANVTFCFRIQYSDNNLESSHITFHFDRNNKIGKIHSTLFQLSYYFQIEVPGQKTNKNITIIISVLCSTVVGLLILIKLCRNRMKTLQERNNISDDILTEILKDTQEYMTAENDTSSSNELSESSGIYSISRSVSDESVQDDHTDVKTLHVQQDRTIAFENPLVGTELQLPLPVPSSDGLSDSDDNYATTGPEEMRKYVNELQKQFVENETVGKNVNTQLNGTSTNFEQLHGSGDQINDLHHVNDKGIVISEDVDDYATPVIGAMVEIKSDGYEIARDQIILSNEYPQGNDQQRESISSFY
ncbi:uncharacterized protein LOC132733313 [Ruditapes philippinarum]|uniref:uncharacterized protein LOC132733313 n=1 Tax=Ruditapes philippinarum TaxID=129788 RepID=UPI00295B585A|nr:uncharacterized protein LOC132733313 [Ruditapes philippinarum]